MKGDDDSLSLRWSAIVALGAEFVGGAEAGATPPNCDLKRSAVPTSWMYGRFSKRAAHVSSGPMTVLRRLLRAKEPLDECRALVGRVRVSINLNVIVQELMDLRKLTARKTDGSVAS